MTEVVTVVIASFRRPASLQRCLVAMEAQSRVPDQMVVAVRDSDPDTAQLLATSRWPWRLDVVRTGEPGVVAALNAAVTVAAGDIIAFIDDDTEPRPDWLGRIVAHFERDAALGGLGGRDLQPGGWSPLERMPRSVGKLQWFGRVIGNHHLMTGGPREADVLKGANMTYRRSAISGLRFDHRLRGAGAQVHFEIAFSLAVKRRGWRLLCDPLVVVDHYPAARFDDDARTAPSRDAVANAVHNETLALLEHLRWWQLPIFAVWSVLLGTRAAPGLGQWIRMWFWPAHVRRTPFGPSLRGRIGGWRTWILENERRSPKDQSSRTDGAAVQDIC